MSHCGGLRTICASVLIFVLQRSVHAIRGSDNVDSTLQSDQHEAHGFGKKTCCCTCQFNFQSFKPEVSGEAIAKSATCAGTIVKAKKCEDACMQLDDEAKKALCPAGLPDCSSQSDNSADDKSKYQMCCEGKERHNKVDMACPHSTAKKCVSKLAAARYASLYSGQHGSGGTPWDYYKQFVDPCKKCVDLVTPTLMNEVGGEHDDPVTARKAADQMCSDNADRGEGARQECVDRMKEILKESDTVVDEDVPAQAMTMCSKGAAHAASSLIMMALKTS